MRSYWVSGIIDLLALAPHPFSVSNCLIDTSGARWVQVVQEMWVLLNEPVPHIGWGFPEIVEVSWSLTGTFCTVLASIAQASLVILSWSR